MSLQFTLLFIMAASMGALIRFKILLMSGTHWGTLLINFLGSLLIGFLAIYLQKFDPLYKTILLVAFLGSLTTFSSYSLDIVKLFEQGLIAKALLYALMSNTLCVAGCYLGWKIAQV
jgi:fluoride exporter